MPVPLLARRSGPRWSSRAVATAVGLLADRYVGEPPVDPHPVAAFGAVMQSFERRAYDDERAAGMIHTCVGLTLGVAAGACVHSTVVGTYLAVAGRALGQAAQDVADPLARDDVEGARCQLSALVGRDPSRLGRIDIIRAVVESVAENTTDAIVAPALWGVVAGAPGALGYRAVNTMDAMVGHRSSRYARYGWASARLDDLANWAPARITALLVMAVRPHRAGAVWQAVRRDAPSHPSPNSGVAEAAFAAALGLRLGGTNHYGDRVEVRGPLGQGRVAEVGDIAAAVRLCDEVQVALAVVLGGLGGLGVMAGLPKRARARTT
jgi:adenosylcobinamide-phosphate synthase